MKVKPKKCKGTGKANSLGCGNISILKRYGLCSNCWRLFLLNTKEGKEILQRSTVIAKRKIETTKKEKHKRAKVENKSIAVMIQEARMPFQKLIRIRDHGKQCICCERPLPFNIGDYDGGHFLKAELYASLIFHPDNVHGQTVYCNKHNHGNESGYNSGLITRIGVLRYNELISLKKSLKSYKWDRYKLIELKKYYNKELKQVEKGLKNIKDVDLSIGIINI